MDAPITYSEIVEAVDIAHRGINHGDTITMDTWDRILPTLIQAHTLCGGLTRTLIRRLFAATYTDCHTLAGVLDEPHCALAPTRPAAIRPQRSHRRRRPAAGQLPLFS
jgi:hypothetical protein